ncbi:Smr/MutS family protein [Viridibacterium curvum]|uniref:Smr domain-containing protein n=1 Tax=Viridibacterium curvum TaxID=1101404 RepID=A0ABP9QAD0_9RHOO
MEMSRNKLPSLAEVRRRLKQPSAPVAAPVADDAALFRQATAGTTEIARSDRVELRRGPAPKPVPRPRIPEEAPEPPKAPRADNPLALPDTWFDNTTVPLGSSEDQALARALQGVKPIQTDRVVKETPKPRPLPIQHERDEQAALAESIYAPTPLDLVLEGGDELHYLKEGMPRSMLRDLRRGRWVVEAELDLHGANRDQARDILAAAFAQWRKQDIRCVRIIHGKGLGSPGKEPVLKKLVAGWLTNYADVLAYAQARVHDGGAGALLVLMRSSRR